MEYQLCLKVKGLDFEYLLAVEIEMLRGFEIGIGS